MNFELSEDQQAIRSAARELLAARYPPEEVRRLAFEEPRGFTDAQWEEIAGLGWPGLALPERDGGQGLGAVELAIVAEQVGYALAPGPLGSTWAAGLVLSAAGGHARLGDVAAGTARATLADDDDGEVPVEASDGVLTGVKTLVEDAHAADLLVVSVDGERLFAVDAGADGVEIRPLVALDPTRRLFEVSFDATPAEELAGDPAAIMRAGDIAAVAVAAECVGIGQRTLEMAVAYARERQQFGRPIGTFQAVSHRCAQMLLEVEGARSAVLWAAWALDHEPETALLAASCAKAYASDCATRVTGSALQVLGGVGFTWEHDLHLYLKRAHHDARIFGDARWHRERALAAALAAAED